MSKIKRKNHIIAVICELNPPHAGHANLVAQTRHAYPDGAVVAIMSPNFVQRGEPAIFAKHARAAAALDIGFDLVIELPMQFALSSAEGFARAGLALAVAIGANTLAFGAECGDLDALKRAADALNSEECEARTRAELALGASYARARQAALDAILGDGADVLRSPNNLLGIEYIRAAARIGAEFGFFVIRREAGVSATAERAKIRESGDAVAMLPESLDVAVLSRLRTMSVDDFAQIVGGDDGVAERAARYAPTAASIDELAQSIKTKRHTMSRVKRFILASALGITRDDAAAPQYLRVLAANATGREVLRTAAPVGDGLSPSPNNALPVITKPAAARDLLALEAAATDLYNLGQGDVALRKGGTEWRTSPIMP